MTPNDDLAIIALQERRLTFRRFDEEMAWAVGSQLRSWGIEQAAPIVIDVRLFHRELFYAALPGSAPDNDEWVRRKINVVRRFHRSSYAVGLETKAKGGTLESRYGLSLTEYAAHGGAFPVTVDGVGVIGSITVSGLPQRDDHGLVVRTLCATLDVSPTDVAFADRR